MPLTFVSHCSTETYTEAKKREHSRKHEQPTCVPINFIDGAMINLIKTQKNTDGEYLEEMKTFKQIDLPPNKCNDVMLTFCIRVTVWRDIKFSHVSHMMCNRIFVGIKNWSVFVL